MRKYKSGEFFPQYCLCRNFPLAKISRYTVLSIPNSTNINTTTSTRKHGRSSMEELCAFLVIKFIKRSGRKLSVKCWDRYTMALKKELSVTDYGMAS